MPSFIARLRMGLRLGPGPHLLALAWLLVAPDLGPLTDALLPPPMNRFHNNKTCVFSQGFWLFNKVSLFSSEL